MEKYLKYKRKYLQELYAGAVPVTIQTPKGPATVIKSHKISELTPEILEDMFEDIGAINIDEIRQYFPNVTHAYKVNYSEYKYKQLDLDKLQKWINTLENGEYKGKTPREFIAEYKKRHGETIITPDSCYTDVTLTNHTKWILQ